MKTLLIVAALLSINSCTNSFMPEFENEISTELKLSVEFLEGTWKNSQPIPISYTFKKDSTYQMIHHFVDKEVVFEGTFHYNDSTIFHTFVDPISLKSCSCVSPVEILNENEILMHGILHEKQ